MDEATNAKIAAKRAELEGMKKRRKMLYYYGFGSEEKSAQTGVVRQTRGATQKKIFDATRKERKKLRESGVLTEFKDLSGVLEEFKKKELRERFENLEREYEKDRDSQKPDDPPENSEGKDDWRDPYDYLKYYGLLDVDTSTSKSSHV